MELAGLVIGVFGVPGSIKSCLDLWGDVSNGLRVSNDLNNFICRVNWERIEFINFCNASGLWDLVHHVENDTTPKRPVQAATDVGRLTSSQSIDDMIRQSVVANINAIQGHLLDVKKLLISYDAWGPPRKRKLLQKRALALVYARQTTQEQGQTIRRNGTWDRVAWGATGYKESQRLLDNLRQCNAELKGALEMVNKLQALSAQRMTEVLASCLPFADMMTNEAPGLSSLGGTNTGSSFLVPLSQMSKREKEASELGSAPATSSTGPSVAVRAEEGLELRSKDFCLRLDESKPPPEREFTTYKGVSVMVEWRYYSRRLSPVERDLLHHRIGLLILQLQQSSSVAGFRVPPCIGFFHSTSTARYGIVFKAAQNPPVRTLWDCIANDSGKKRNRVLDARIRLARQLVVSVFRFFSVGWLHKNIRSSSVLFLDADPSRLDLPDVYLAGFGFARMDSSTSTTERNPSRYQPVQETREWSLYCHPERLEALKIAGAGDPPASTLSHMRYDAFGLGVILLEIALWSLVVDVAKNKTVKEFQAGMAETTANLVRCMMGERYAAVVRRLLQGDFGEEPVQDGDEEEERLVFLAAFERTVVTEMEALCIDGN